MDLPITVPLKRSVIHDGKTYDALTLDEPCLDDQIAYQELLETVTLVPSPEGDEGEPLTSARDAMRVTRFWIPRLSGVPEAVAGKLKSEDQAEVTRVLDRLWGAVDPDPAGNDEAA